MMVVRFMGSALVALVLAASASAQFNSEALQSMQEEGHKIVEEADAKTKAKETRRTYSMNGSLCLDRKGTSLVVNACNNKASQRWLIDTKRQLVSNNGWCVSGATLVKCSGGPTQLWRQDGKKRLRNDSQQCLQVQGASAKAGSKVAAAACSQSSAQVWR